MKNWIAVIFILLLSASVVRAQPWVLTSPGHGAAPQWLAPTGGGGGAWSVLTPPGAVAIGDLLLGTAPNTVGVLAPGASGQVLTSQGPGVAPQWTAAASAPVTLDGVVTGPSDATTFNTTPNPLLISNSLSLTGNVTGNTLMFDSWTNKAHSGPPTATYGLKVGNNQSFWADKIYGNLTPYPHLYNGFQINGQAVSGLTACTTTTVGVFQFVNDATPESCADGTNPIAGGNIGYYCAVMCGSHDNTTYHWFSTGGGGSAAPVTLSGVVSGPSNATIFATSPTPLTMNNSLTFTGGKTLSIDVIHGVGGVYRTDFPGGLQAENPVIISAPAPLMVDIIEDGGGNGNVTFPQGLKTDLINGNNPTSFPKGVLIPSSGSLKANFITDATTPTPGPPTFPVGLKVASGYMVQASSITNNAGTGPPNMNYGAIFGNLTVAALPTCNSAIRGARRTVNDATAASCVPATPIVGGNSGFDCGVLCGTHDNSVTFNWYAD